ncbi:MAG TPA: hypothetical protein VGF30_15690 [Bacteroidia bacterium]
MRVATYILISVLCCNLSGLKAQHCQYDFYELIGIVPFAGDSTNVVNNLRISLVDAKGNPVIQSQGIYKGKNKEVGRADMPLVFWRNPKPNKDVDHFASNIQSRHFPFAQNHYLLAFNAGQKKQKEYFIKLEDIDSTQNGGHFISRIIKLPINETLSLCGYSSRSDHHAQYYKPVYIDLNSKRGVNEKFIPLGMTKELDGYRYEIDSTAVEAISINVDVKALKLFVYSISDNKLVWEGLVSIKALPKINQKLIDFELLHVNFDGIPDVIFKHEGNTTVYVLSRKNEEESIKFYKNNILSGRDDFERNNENKTLVFMEHTNAFDITYTFKGIYSDTLVKVFQSISKPVSAQQFYLLNQFEDGFKQMGSINPRFVAPVAKKEFADYNSDGHEDYRIQELVLPNNNWNYYLWDSTLQQHVKDSLMSSLNTYFEYGKFLGYSSTLINELTNQYDTYEFRNGKLIVVKRSVCVHKFRFSERSDCSIYEWKNGKLEFIELILGPE